MKTYEQVVKYMWEKYPDSENEQENIENMICRGAMLECYKFMTGRVDQENAEKEKISTVIMKKLQDKIRG